MLPMIEQKVQQNARIDLIRGYQAEYIPPNESHEATSCCASHQRRCILRKNEDHISLNRKILNQRSANLPPPPPKKTKLLAHFISARHLATQISQRQPRRRGRSRSLPDIGTCALTLRPPNPPASARHQSKSHRTEASQPRSDQITQHRAGKEEMGLGSPREEPPARRAPPPPPPPLAAPPAVPWEGAAAQVAVDDPRRAV